MIIYGTIEYKASYLIKGTELLPKHLFQYALCVPLSFFLKYIFDIFNFNRIAWKNSKVESQ